MPYPREHRVAKRRELICIASRLFTRRGFDAVSIDEIMAHAGLTRGGFYSYFASKSQLYELAMEETLMSPHAASHCRDNDTFDAAQRMIEAYLSQARLGAGDNQCLTITLPADVARCDVRVKLAFENAFRGLVSLFEGCLERDRRPSRDRALAISNLCIGASVIARALVDSRLATEVCSGAMRIAFDLGGWSSHEDLPESGMRRDALVRTEQERPRSS